MIEIIGIILLSIVAIIMIMAIIGYFMEKNQKKVAVNSSTVVLQDGINENKNVNAATNAEIPNVMNFNDISNNLEKKQNTTNNVGVSNNMVQNSEVANENMTNSNAATNAEIPQVMDFNQISDDLNKKEIASNTENSSQLI